MDSQDQRGSVTEAEIEVRAHQLWIEEGNPSDSAERHWLEAERELTSAAKSRNLLEKVKQQGGSVQR
jgi:hypothetical protein